MIWKTSNPVFLVNIWATSGSSRCPISSATQLPASSTAKAMFSLSSYRSRAVRNGEMPRIAATSLPPIPRLRYASHSCSVRFSVLTSTLGSCRMCSGIFSPSSRAGDRDAWAGCAHCTADTQIAWDGSCLARARDAPVRLHWVLPVHSFGVPPFLYRMYFSKPVGSETK